MTQLPIRSGKVHMLRNGELRTPVYFAMLLPRDVFDLITEIFRRHSGYFNPAHRAWLIPAGAYKKVEAAVAEALREEA